MQKRKPPRYAAQPEELRLNSEISWNYGNIS